MTILTNFKAYTPEDEESQLFMQELGITYLVSGEGVDWYKSQHLFKPDLLKVVFSWQTGEIASVSQDITSLWPFGLCVADVAYDVSVQVEDLRDKVFDVKTGTIKDRVYTKEELTASAKDKSTTLQSAASALIAPLQYAKDLEIITEDESAYLSNLQRYVVNLHRIASQDGYPTQIEWPVLPTK